MPLAYLHFGELFMAEALKEPNRAPMAANFYRETMKYPPEDSSVYFYAALRLGQVEQLQGEHERALVAFKTVAEGEGGHHDSPCMTTLAAHARTGLVGSYAAAGDPSKAFDFFRPLSGDRDGQNTRTQRLLVRLADALAQRGSVGALVVIRGIVMRKPNVGICRELADLVRASSFLTAERAPELVQSCR